MRFLSLRSGLTRGLGAVILACAAWGSAQAAIVVGKWDPQYGAPFTDLGWRGSVTVDVPAACLSQPGPAGYAVAGPCSPVTVLDATVEFYDVTDPLEITLEALDFTASLVVSAIGIQSPGVPLGLQAISGPVAAASTDLAKFAGVFASFTLELDFTLLDGPTALLHWSVDPQICVDDPGLGDCFGVNDSDQFPAVVSYSVVSEPASLALIGVSLVAAGLARRRTPAR